MARCASDAGSNTLWSSVVVKGMDRNLVGVVDGRFFNLLIGHAPNFIWIHITSVLDMDLDAGAERSLEILVVSFPCNYLCVGA